MKAGSRKQKAGSGELLITPNFAGGLLSQRQRRGMFIARDRKKPSSSVRSDIYPRRCRPAGAEELLSPQSYKHSAPLGLCLLPAACCLLLGMFVLLVCGATVVSAQQPANVQSPEIGADQRVTFRLNAPKAQEVVLTGEFLKGGKPLVKDANGVWTVTVGPIEPEIYHYNFTVDGVRITDPANPNLKTGSTASTLASVLEVRGDAPSFYDGQNVPHGEIRTDWYHSKSLGSLRRLTVYTPPHYDREPQTRYPVVYLLHGANADETAWYRLGRVNFILDNLLATSKIKPFIVVMPFGYGVVPGGPQAENTAKFGKDLVEDVIPYIEANYRTFTDRDRRAIVGLSMGGGQALTIGLSNLDLFSHVAGFSSGLGKPESFPKTYASLIGQPETANRKIRMLWVGCGTEDGAFRASKEFSEFLNKHNIRHTFRESGGAHTWIVWRRYMHEISPLLFQ